MVESAKIKPINGFVLIKPDPHYETYQVEGRETGIISSNISYTDVKGERVMIDVRQRNYSVRGTVIKVPHRLNVPDENFRKMNKGVYKEGEHKGMIENAAAVERYNKFSSKVNKYDSDMELNNGDRVFISWKSHDVEAVVSTDIGDLLLVSYSDIVMTIDEENNPKKMINGWVLFTKIKDSSIENEDGVDYKKTSSGLILPVLTESGRTLNNLGVCVLAGTPNRGYKDFPGYEDEKYDISPGEKMLIVKQGVRNLEQLNHREYKEKYYITHRKYIIFTESTAARAGIEFDKLN